MSFIDFCLYIFIAITLKFAMNITTAIILVDWKRKRLKKLNIDESFTVLTLLGDEYVKVERNNSFLYKEYVIKTDYNEQFLLRKNRFFDIFTLIYLQEKKPNLYMDLFADEYEYGKNKCEAYFFELINYTSTPSAKKPENPVNPDNSQPDEKITI